MSEIVCPILKYRGSSTYDVSTYEQLALTNALLNPKKHILDHKSFYERCVNVLKRLTTLKHQYTYVFFNDNLFISRKSTHCGLIFYDSRVSYFSFDLQTNSTYERAKKRNTDASREPPVYVTLNQQKRPIREKYDHNGFCKQP